MQQVSKHLSHSNLDIQRVNFGKLDVTETSGSSSTTQSQSTVDDNVVMGIYHQLKPVTLSYDDKYGNKIQLWQSKKHGLIGAVLNLNGKIRVIRAENIINPLSPAEHGNSLLLRLISVSLKRWDLVFDPIKLQITIWPHMIAAGNHGNVGQIKLYQQKLNSKTLSAAEREKNGDVVKFKSSGIPFDHQNKVREHLKGLNKHIDCLKDRLANQKDKLPSDEIVKIKNELQESERFLKHVNNTKNFYSTYNVGVRYILRPEQKAEGIWKKHELLHQGSPNGEGNGGNGGNPPKGGGSPPPTPGNGQLKEILQKTGLVGTFKSCHPDSDLSKGAGSGKIGGVGCTVELIEGLFDSPESLFETQHSFFIPTLPNGEAPFSIQEMRQLAQEIAKGIFVDDTVPIFSLHFNQDANLYPVIHPAYEKTLVGQVFSLLDYFMKGYLNGGVFKESFIDQWQNNPIKNETTDSLLQELINFKSYANFHLQGSDKNYLSVRDLLKKLELSEMQKAERAVEDTIHSTIDKDYQAENPIFRDFTKFTNSFRIIAKQRGIHKAESLFMINSDFDVEYTVAPDPDYKEALEEHYKLYGVYPEAYSNLLKSYELMKERIHDHMVKMPFCQKYFAMLGVINFFSYYFMTLKKHNKVPILPEVALQPAQSPSIFPPLPLLSTRKEVLQANDHNIIKLLLRSHKSLLKKHLLQNLEPKEFENVHKALAKYIWNEAYKYSSSPFKRSQDDHLQCQNLCSNHGESLFASLKNIFQQLLEETKHMPNVKPIKEMVDFVVDKLPELFENTPSDFAYMYLSLFVTPSEQTHEERELGKRIVGGCGMDISPLKVQLSETARSILNESWAKIQDSSADCWTSVASDAPEKPLGVVFTLPFIDIPIDYPRDRANMELILTPVGDNLASIVCQHQVIRSILQENREEFKNLLKNTAITKIRDRENRSLLHHSASVEDIFFTKELLSIGMSTSLQDEKEYLPIHYAAMSGHISQLRILVENNKKDVYARSNHGATPLIVAIQHDQYLAADYLLLTGVGGDERLKDGYSALHCAVHHGNEKIIRLLLENSKAALETINSPTNEGIVPLMIACRLGSLPIVAYLLEKGADPKLKAKNGTTALEIAVKKNHFQLCSLLANRSNLTPITIETAIRKGSLDINKLLVGLPGYLTYTNPINDPPLLMAIRYANIPVAKLILGLINDPTQLNLKNRLKETAVMLTIKGKFYSLLELLLKQGASITTYELFDRLLQTGYHGQCSFLDPWLNRALKPNEINQLILTAVKAGNHVAISKLLLPKGGDLSKIVDDHGWKIDHYLAKSDGIYLFRKRMQETKNLLQPLPHEGGKTLPYIAGENGSWRVFEFLIDQLKSTNSSFEMHYKRRHLFFSVLQKGDLEGIRLFIELTGDSTILNKPVDNDKTLPVHLAAKYCSLEALEYMYKQGAKFKVKNHLGHYPIYYAIQRMNKPLTEFFLEDSHSCPITADALDAALLLDEEEIFDSLVNICSDAEKSRALFLAIDRHDSKGCLRLIQKKASLSLRNDQEYTPFLLAAHKGNVDIMSMILSINSNAAQEKIYGNNALHIACRNRHEHCVRFLVEHGFSNKEPNAKGKTPTELANNDLSVVHYLGIAKNQIYQNQIEILQDAIKRQDLSSILNLLNTWPVNSYFTINIKGMSFRGTLLHIALSLCGSCSEIRTLIIGVGERPEFNPMLRDSSGNTYAHLMMEKKIDATKFSIFDVLGVNHQQKSTLHTAAIQDCEDNLLNLIKKFDPSKIDTMDQNGRTPLFYAINANKLKNVLALIKAGANLEHRDHYGVTPLIYACEIGNYPIIRRLVESGADINRSGGVEGLTPLSKSLFSKHEELPLYLLFNGAKLESKNVEGELIGNIASQKGKIYILRFLAEQGISLSSTNSEGLQPIHQAAAMGKIKSLEFLTSEGISVETPIIDTEFREKKSQSIAGATPILLASLQGTVDAVKWLLEHGANPEIETLSGINILKNALQNTSVNSQNIIQLLKEFNLIHNLNQILPAISIAIHKDYVQPLKLLYEMGIPIHSKLAHGHTGLHYACMYGSLQSTQFLLTHGADWKAISDNGETPLELAAVNSSSEQFQLMIKHTTPDLNEQNQKGETVMHLATRAGNLSHIMLLIDAGADFDLQDAQGRTPLHIASEKGFKDIATLLIVCGANLEAKTFYSSFKPEQFAEGEMKNAISRLITLKQNVADGSTPLHIAAKACHPLSVRLTARHFDLNAKNSLGQTPLHDAVIAGSLEIIRELLEQGAKLNAKDLKDLTPLQICRSVRPNPAIEKFLLAAGAH